MGYAAFFVIISYHTPYASPWIIPPLVFYGFDVFVRMIRCRFKDAVLVPMDQQFTLVGRFHLQ